MLGQFLHYEMDLARNMDHFTSIMYRSHKFNKIVPNNATVVTPELVVVHKLAVHVL